MRRGHNGSYVCRYNHNSEMNDPGHRREAVMVFLLRKAGVVVKIDRFEDENGRVDFRVVLEDYPIPVQFKTRPIGKEEAAKLAAQGIVPAYVSGRLLDRAATPSQILNYDAACKAVQEFKKWFEKYAPIVVEVRWGRKAK